MINSSDSLHRHTSKNGSFPSCLLLISKLDPCFDAVEITEELLDQVAGEDYKSFIHIVRNTTVLLRIVGSVGIYMLTMGYCIEVVTTLRLVNGSVHAQYIT